VAAVAAAIKERDSSTAVGKLSNITPSVRQFLERVRPTSDRMSDSGGRDNCRILMVAAMAAAVGLLHLL